MKGNSYIFTNSSLNSYLLNHDVCVNNVSEKSLNDSFYGVKSNTIKNYNFLIQFWKRLVFNPFSLPQNPNPNATISSILEVEIGELASDAVKLVLSQELELSLNSIELLKAIEDSINIYHEDYPYDFVLEYKGDRLGLMILDKCINSNGKEELIYRFNPHITSFRGFF